MHTKYTSTNTRIRIGLALVGTLFAATSAHATTLSYNFVTTSGSSSTSTYGDVITFAQFEASLGVTMKVTGWATTGTGTGTSRKLQTTYVPQFTSYAPGYGLGNCNQIDGTANCITDLPTHQTDNINGVYEFIMFQFDTPVSPSSVTIDPYNPPGGYDRDMTVFMGTATYGVDLAGKTIAGLSGIGLTTRLDFDSTTSEEALVVALSSPVKVNTILVAARIPGGTVTPDGNSDRFKLDGISVMIAPEPGTFALVGLALVGLGLARRRPKAS